MKYYAGIGSRETPPDICQLFTLIAARMEANGYTLRSGGANGADIAFEKGVNTGTNKEIFLPWKGFNGSPSLLFSPSKDAFEMAAIYHPAWNRLSDAALKMMARNCHQVLGLNLNSPVDIVICWTPNGSGSGGTGQAIRIANAYNIPVVDFGKGSNKDNLNRIKEIMNV